MTNLELLQEGDLLAEGFDSAVVGIMVSANKKGDVLRRVVYDEERVLELLELGGMDPEEACDYYCNVEGAYVGEQTPVFITPRW